MKKDKFKAGIYFIETTIVFIIAIPIPVQTLSAKNGQQLRILKDKIFIFPESNV